jgi:nucleoside-diphosphate-sugar epimerase
MIHRDDVVGCLQAALDRGRTGELYHAVDDEPVTQIAFFQWLADQLGKPLPPRVPAAEVQRQRAVTNKRISNHKLKAELSYQFRYPTFREGYASLIVEAKTRNAGRL